MCIWCATAQTKIFQETDRVEAIVMELVLVITAKGPALNREAQVSARATSRACTRYQRRHDAGYPDLRKNGDSPEACQVMGIFAKTPCCDPLSENMFMPGDDWMLAEARAVGK